jgi:hypothetical protein
VSLAIREVWAALGHHDVGDLTDTQLIDAAEILIERYGTTSPAASMRAGVLDEVRAGSRPGGPPAAPRPPIDPVELLAFERDHPDHPDRMAAKWRAVGKRFDRSPYAYTDLVLRAAETPEGRAAFPEVCEAIIGRRDVLRAVRSGV